MINDPDPHVRAGSARILLSHSFVPNHDGCPEHLTYVTQLLYDSEWRVRRVALVEIACLVNDAGWQTQHPHVLAHLTDAAANLLFDSKPIVRGLSVKLLDILGEAGLRYTHKVAHLLQDPNDGVRHAAASMLGAHYADTMHTDRKNNPVAGAHARHQCIYCHAIHKAFDKWVKVDAAVLYYSHTQGAYHKATVKEINTTGVKVVFVQDPARYKHIPFLRVLEHLVNKNNTGWWYQTLKKAAAHTNLQPPSPIEIEVQQGVPRSHLLTPPAPPACHGS